MKFSTYPCTCSNTTRFFDFLCFLNTTFGGRRGFCWAFDLFSRVSRIFETLIDEGGTSSIILKHFINKNISNISFMRCVPRKFNYPRSKSPVILNELSLFDWQVSTWFSKIHKISILKYGRYIKKITFGNMFIELVFLFLIKFWLKINLYKKNRFLPNSFYRVFQKYETLLFFKVHSLVHNRVIWEYYRFIIEEKLFVKFKTFCIKQNGNNWIDTLCGLIFSHYIFTPKSCSHLM